MIFLTTILLTLSLAHRTAAQDEDDREDGRESDICVLLMFIVGFSLFGILWLWRRHKIETVGKILQRLEKDEPWWNRERLIGFTGKAFTDIKTAWSEKERTKLERMLDGNLYAEWSAVLDTMDDLGQRNVTRDMEIGKIDIVDLQDYTNEERDRFTAEISATTTDYTVDGDGEWVDPGWSETAHENPFMEPAPVTELWTFIFHQGEWKLMKVEQASAEMKYVVHRPVLEDEKHGNAGKR